MHLLDVVVDVLDEVLGLGGDWDPNGDVGSSEPGAWGCFGGPLDSHRQEQDGRAIPLGIGHQPNDFCR